MKTNKTVPNLTDKTFTLSLKITKSQIQEENNKVLKSIQKTYKNTGFRVGKVPLDIITQNISPKKIIEEIVSSLLPHLYSQKIKKLKLNPIIQPQVKFINPPISLDKDWQIEITSCELPDLKLKTSYIAQIKKLNLDKDKDQTRPILDVLVKNSQVKLPPILVETEMQKQLSSLVDQTQQAGLEISQYLKSKNTTLEEYKKNLLEQIKRQWIINLAIDKICQKEKLKIDQEDIQKALKINPAINPQSEHLYHILLQQKTLDFLKKL
ncbi:hypothetical protein KJ909_03350 [Patescibacteria group bacterium]|nr:hypothetical protein [Patescibacteria group bacterium]